MIVSRKIERIALADQVYEVLKERILDQVYEVGQRLNIDALVRELSVNSRRRPVRRSAA